jgi:hypothetical protein
VIKILNSGSVRHLVESLGLRINPTRGLYPHKTTIADAEKRGHENSRASIIFIGSYSMSAIINISASRKQVYKAKSAFT